MKFDRMTPQGVAEALGERLKQWRLNRDVTQVEVAERAGVSRKVVLNAEKGKVSLEALVAILQALDCADQLDRFLPAPLASPLQLAELRGRQRQRASGKHRQPGDEPDSGDAPW
ncbi:MAG: helix-turn-helix transcriptional regulator [Pseudomonadota bacterium]